MNYILIFEGILILINFNTVLFFIKITLNLREKNIFSFNTPLRPNYRNVKIFGSLVLLCAIVHPTAHTHTHIHTHTFTHTHILNKNIIKITMNFIHASKIF